MPGVFNVSFLRPGAVKARSDYGTLIDQIAIKKNELSIDGNLSPGDYDVLIKLAKDVYSHPGLTPDQRSNVNVQISNLTKDKAVNSLNRQNDIESLKREYKDDERTINMRFANRPDLLLQAKADALQMKAETLSQSIDTLENSGQDASAHSIEMSQTLQDLQDTMDSLDAVKQYQPGSNKPTSDYVAYLDTNSRGEITNVEITRPTSKSGYAETNALYGGLQVYGRVNARKSGKAIFRLGSTEYSGSDLMVQDPQNPGSFRSAPLMAGGKNLGRGIQIENFQEINPNDVRPQQTIRAGSWARGQSGTLYQSLPTGGYRKYVGVLPDQLALDQADILDVPKATELGINFQSVETVDGNAQKVPLMSTQIPGLYDKLRSAPAPEMLAPTGPIQSKVPAPETPGGMSKTPAPTERTPSGVLGYAGKVMSSVKSLFS